MRLTFELVLVALVSSALVAPSARAAAPKVVLAAAPAQLDLGALEAGAKRQVSFALANQGTAAATKVTCKATGFTFDKKNLTIAAGAKETLAATYAAAKKAPAKDKPLKVKITCGTASVAVQGVLLAKIAAKSAPAVAAPPAEKAPDAAKPQEAAKPAGAPGVKAKNAPDKILLDDCRDKKAAVPFGHKQHINEGKIACDTCHHTQKGLKAGSDAVVKKCAACHLNPTDKAPSCKEKSSSKNPYHIRCLGCHKEKSDPKAPTKCADCHKS